MNSSTNETTTSFKETVCLEVPKEFFISDPNVLVPNMILNIMLSITATLGNLLVLVAVWRSTHLRSSSTILLCGLAVSDLCVGLISEPLHIGMQILLLKKNPVSCTLTSFQILTFTFLTEVTFLNVTAISIDRYFAIHFHLRYVEMVTEKRTKMAILCFWFLSGLQSLTWSIGYDLYFSVMFGVGTFCLFTVLSVWIKIYQVVRRHQAEIQDQMNIQTQQFNMVRFRKSAINTMIILIVFVFCYLPYFVVTLIFINYSGNNSNYVIGKFVYSFVLLNSSLNPLLYCCRLRDFRSAAKQTLVNLCCSTHDQ